MRDTLLTRRRPFAVLAALIGLVVAGACGAKATIETDPSAADVQRVRALAVRTADAVKLSLVIADEAGRLAAALPLDAATKTSIDCAVLRVTGPSGTAPPETTAAVTRACGTIASSPLKLALEELPKVTARPQLSNTIQRVGAATSPLIDRLEASGNGGLRALATVLRTAFAFVSELSPAPIAWRLGPAWEVL